MLGMTAKNKHSFEQRNAIFGQILGENILKTISSVHGEVAKLIKMEVSTNSFNDP
jgi:hypothetical protein